MSNWQLSLERGTKNTLEVPATTPAYLQDPHSEAAAAQSVQPQNQSTEDQAISQVQETEVDQTQDAPEESAEETLVQKKSRLDSEYNFREYRKEYRRLQEENEHLKNERMRSYAAPAKKEEEIEEEVRPDDIVEGKHLKRMSQKMQQLESKLEQSSVEIRLRSNFHDFDSVVTPGNLETLRDSHPELYDTIYTSKDLYNKAAAAYKMIKKFGVESMAVAAQEGRVAQKNVLKPRTVTSIAPQQGTSPLSQANAFASGLTPELQKQLLREMNDARKGI